MRPAGLTEQQGAAAIGLVGQAAAAYTSYEHGEDVLARQEQVLRASAGASADAIAASVSAHDAAAIVALVRAKLAVAQTGEERTQLEGQLHAWQGAAALAAAAGRRNTIIVAGVSVLALGAIAAAIYIAMRKRR